MASVRERDGGERVAYVGNKGKLRQDCAPAPQCCDKPKKSAVQQRHGGLVDAPIAAGQNGLAVAAIPAIPGRDDPARAIYQRNQGGDVPGLEARLDDNVHKAQRQRREQITVSAVAGHARGIADALERGGLLGRKIREGIGGAENGVFQLGAFAYFQGGAFFAFQQNGASVDAQETLAQHRLVENAQHRYAVMLQRDQGAPFMPPGDEGARAVHGIQHPAPFVIGLTARLLAIFLAQDGVVGTLALDDGADGAFGALVGLGNGIEGMDTGLVNDRDKLAEEGPDHRAAGVRQAMGKSNKLLIHGHGAAFQKETINPPVTIMMPPSITGMVGSVRKAKKVISCHITNRVAIYRPTTLPNSSGARLRKVP